MKVKLILESLARYILGLIMVAYGLIKILEIQFRLPPSSYEIPLGNLDGVTLTWAFLGYSSWFTILLGVFEFVPGVLLLFRRTKLIAEIILLPILAGIFLVNNAYHFLPYKKLFTGCLFIINILLLGVHKTFFRSIIKQITCSKAIYPRAEALGNMT